MIKDISLLTSTSFASGIEEAERKTQGLCALADTASQLRAKNPKAKFFIDEHQAELVTGFAVATLRKRRWQGLPPQFYKIGSKIRYDYFELQDFLNSCARSSTTDNGRG